MVGLRLWNGGAKDIPQQAPGLWKANVLLILAYYWHCYPFIKNDLNTPETLCILSTPCFFVKLSPICKSNREIGIFRVPKLANTCNNIINTMEIIKAYNYFLDSTSLVIANILGILIRILLETKYPVLCPSPQNCDFSFRAIFFFQIHYRHFTGNANCRHMIIRQKIHTNMSFLLEQAVGNYVMVLVNKSPCLTKSTYSETQRLQCVSVQINCIGCLTNVMHSAHIFLCS